MAMDEDWDDQWFTENKRPWENRTLAFIDHIHIGEKVRGLRLMC